MIVPNYAGGADLRAKATTETVAAIDGLQGVQLDRLLTYSSRVVRHATRAAIYPTDANFLPSDPAHKAAFTEATALHALALIEGGLVDDVLTGGLKADASVSSTSENGASLTFDNSAQDLAMARLRAGMLSNEAEWVLRDAGLLGELPLIYF